MMGCGDGEMACGSCGRSAALKIERTVTPRHTTIRSALSPKISTQKSTAKTGKIGPSNDREKNRV